MRKTAYVSPSKEIQFMSIQKVATLLLIFTLAVGFGFSQPARAQVAADNPSRMLSNAENLGAEDLSKQITVTVWLKHHNQAAFDELVREMYDPSSPNYHHFLTLEQYHANFAPTAREAAAVRDFLTARNLSVSSVEKNNHFVSAQGRVADVQNAFKVQINRFRIASGEIRRANLSEPSIEGPAATVVAAVQGLNDLRYQSYARRPINPDTGGPARGIPLKSAGGPGSNGLFFTANCLGGPATKTFTTPGGGPSAVYTGNTYGSGIASVPPGAPQCGYDAADMQAIYGLDTVFANGFAGTGQTIVIVDAFGSNTILADANTFSRLNKLPRLTSKNFQIVKPNGTATCTAKNGCIAGNWQFETTLDVESAHSIAPAANILLVLAADNSGTNLDIANLFAIDNLAGNVISNSFGLPEIVFVDLGPSALVVENNIAMTAAALGISLQVSTGDSGDNLAFDNAIFGINAKSPGFAASSPFATAVGGTSTFLGADHTVKLQTGWGLNFARIANPNPNPPVVPPLGFGFNGGAGGGPSSVFAKPAFQSALPGDFRQTPDISMVADPETGLELIVTPDSVPGHPQLVEVFGGTSLSAPMFSAMWALTNQAAGGGPIGQAAPLLYNLPPHAINDVRQVGSPNNVTGVISIPNTPPKPPTIIHETAKALAAPSACAAPPCTLGGTQNFVSALFQSSTSTRWDVFVFGTDSSLTTGPGWDNVTGLGTPNGLAFINAAVAASAGGGAAATH
jgi:subtilase family serine protease